MTDAIEGTCHCGTVHVTVQSLPKDLNDCQCEHCQKRGALWAYYQAPEVTITGPTKTYRWGEHPMIDFHFCMTCGCSTHWTPIDQTYPRMGINGRLFGSAVFHPIPQRKSHPGPG